MTQLTWKTGPGPGGGNWVAGPQLLTSQGPGGGIWIGGSGQLMFERMLELQTAAWLDPVSGPIRHLVIDIPANPNVLVPHVWLGRVPFRDAVEAVQSGNPGIYAHHSYLSGAVPDSVLGDLDKGAGVSQEAGWFAGKFKKDQIVPAVEAMVSDLTKMDRIRSGGTIVIGGSLAGGTGSSLLFYLAYLVKHTIAKLNSSMLANIQVIGLFLGPASFLPLNGLQTEFQRNTGASLDALDKVLGRRLKGQFIVFPQTDRRPAMKLRLDESPFDLVVLGDVTRDREPTLGDNKVGPAALADAAWVLFNEEVRRAVQENLFNIKFQRGATGLCRVGFDLQVPLHHHSRRLIGQLLASEIVTHTIAQTDGVAAWLDRNLGRPLAATADPFKKCNFLNYDLVLKVLGQKKHDLEWVADLHNVLFGTQTPPPYAGLISEALTHGASVIRAHRVALDGLAPLLRQQIAQAPSPAHLRNFSFLIDALRKRVGVALQTIRDSEQALTVQRGAQDRKLPKKADRTKKYRWSSAAEADLQAAIGNWRNEHKAAEAFVKATTLDVTRILEDARIVSVKEGLAAFLKDLDEIERALGLQFTGFTAMAKTFEANAAATLQEMRKVDGTHELTHVVGLEDLVKTFEAHRDELLDIAQANMAGYSIEEVIRCAELAVANARLDLPRAGVNGASPTPLWATSNIADGTPMFNLRIRLTPALSPSPAPADGVIDRTIPEDFSASIVIEAGRLLPHFAGADEARSIAAELECVHPFILDAMASVAQA